MKSIKLIEKELREKGNFSKFSVLKKMLKEGYKLEDIFKYIKKEVKSKVALLRIFLGKYKGKFTIEEITNNLLKADFEIQEIIRIMDEELPLNFIKKIKNKKEQKEAIKTLLNINIYRKEKILNKIIKDYKFKDYKLLIEILEELNFNSVEVFNILLKNFENKQKKIIEFIIKKYNKDIYYIVENYTSYMYPYLCHNYNDEEIINIFDKLEYIDNEETKEGLLEEIKINRENNKIKKEYNRIKNNEN